MGSSPAPAPNIVYSPPPPPPPPPTPVPTQSLQTQTALDEVSGAQSRLNMQLGAQLDQQNKEFFTTQDVRQTQATGAETRLTLGTQGEQERLGYASQGEQQRLGIAATGEQARKTLLQQQMQDNYVAQRNRDWSQQAYRVGGQPSSGGTPPPPGMVQ